MPRKRGVNHRFCDVKRSLFQRIQSDLEIDQLGLSGQFDNHRSIKTRATRRSSSSSSRVGRSSVTLCFLSNASVSVYHATLAKSATFLRKALPRHGLRQGLPPPHAPSAGQLPSHSEKNSGFRETNRRPRRMKRWVITIPCTPTRWEKGERRQTSQENRRNNNVGR